MSETQGKKPLTRKPLARAGLWRWRRSPLRRRSDLMEAWVLLAAWVLAVVGGVLAGLVTAEAADRTFERQRAERHQVTATVVENPHSAGDAEDKVPTRVANGEPVWVTVRWTAPDGEVRTGRSQAAPDTPAGTHVTIWTDRQGTLAARPLEPTEALVEAALLGVMATAFTGGTVWACAYGVRGCLERRRLAQWDEEWQRIDTRWGRTAG